MDFVGPVILYLHKLADTTEEPTDDHINIRGRNLNAYKLFVCDSANYYYPNGIFHGYNLNTVVLSRNKYEALLEIDKHIVIESKKGPEIQGLIKDMIEYIFEIQPELNQSLNSEKEEDIEILTNYVVHSLDPFKNEGVYIKTCPILVGNIKNNIIIEILVEDVRA